MAPERTQPRTRGVIAAKVRAPRPRVEVVARPRLVDRLREEFRVALVSAPAGFGKTVLVLDWLRERRPAAWLSLDPLDNDAGRFFPHLAAALRTLGTDEAERAAAAVEGLAGRATGGADAELLELFEALGPESVLVLDDAHHLEAGPVTAVLQPLLLELTTGPRIVLVTRVDPPLPLGRLRVDGRLVEIRERDLRFTREEADELFRRLLPAGLDASLVDRLETKTEGWAAGLRLAAVSLERAVDPAAAVAAFTGSHRIMVDYLVEEALEVQEEPVQRFLLETSILPRFTAETCVAVTGAPTAARHLRAVDEADLFLVSLDEAGGWYRYHHLFAELLEYRLRRTRGGDVDALHDRAAALFEAEGDVQEALSQAAAMSEPDRLLGLLDRYGYPILARSEFGAFARWLGRIPDPLAHAYPMFLVALGWFRAQTERAPDMDATLAAIDRAIAAVPDDYPAERIEEARLHREVLRAFWLRMIDRHDEALAVGAEVLDRLPARASGIRAILEFNLAAIHLRRADMMPARARLEAGYEPNLAHGIHYLVLATLGHLGAVAAQLEGIEPARQRLRAAVAFAEKERLAGLPAFAIVLYQLAHVHYLADEPELGRPLLERAIELTSDERETDIRANVLIHQARLEALAGQHDQADEHLARASALAHANNVKPFGTTLDVERARLGALRSGRLQEPEHAPPSAEPCDGWSTWREAEAVLQLQHLLRLGRSREAGKLADRLAAESGPRGRGVALCVARVAGAVTRDEPWEALDAALVAASRRGYVRPILECGPPVRSLLEAATGQPIGAEARAWAKHLLERFAADSDASGPLHADGGAPGARGPAPHGAAAPAMDALTEREQRALALVAGGLSNKAIAKAMFVSVNTVKTHLKHVYAKLDISSRAEAVRRAAELGLVDLEE